MKKLIVPAANAREAAVVADVAVYGVTSLAEAVGVISGAVEVDPVSPGVDEIATKLDRYDVDFADVRDRESANQYIEAARSGLGLGMSPGRGSPARISSVSTSRGPDQEKYPDPTAPHRPVRERRHFRAGSR